MRKLSLRIVNRPFSFFWAGETASMIGDWLNVIALRSLVWELSASPKVMGTLGALQALPVVTLGLVAGVIADRFDRKRLMLLCNLVRFILIGSLALYRNLVWVLAVVFVSGLATTIFAPTKNSVIPMLVKKDEVRTANGWMQMGYTASKVIGPAFAGVLLGLFSYPIVFLLNAFSFAISAMTIQVLPDLPPTTERRTGSPLRDLADGLRWVFAKKELAVVVLVVGLASLGSGAFNTVLVIYSATVFQLGPSGYALFLSSIGAGMVFGVVAAAKAGKRVAVTSRHIVGTITLIGVSLVLIGVAPKVPMVVGGLVVMGVLYGGANVLGLSFVHYSTPKEMMGRVFGLVGFLQDAAILLSAAIAGYCVSFYGVRPVIAVAGLIIAVSGAGALLSLLRMRSQQSAVTGS